LSDHALCVSYHMTTSLQPKHGSGLSLFFFFSSRRLHTSCYRDWSSDVCSSDLVLRGLAELEQEALLEIAGADAGGVEGLDEHERSEERRVGKEWRYWW